jgi:glutaredoxin
MVTIYTNVGCNACHHAMKFMDKMKIDYVEKNIADDPKYIQELNTMGYRMVPVIKVGEETLVGYNESALKKALGI